MDYVDLGLKIAHLHGRWAKILGYRVYPGTLRIALRWRSGAEEEVELKQIRTATIH